MSEPRAVVPSMAANRAVSATVVLSGLALLHGLVPDAARREVWLYLVALPIGYGHLLGGFLFARRRRATTRLETAFMAVGVAVLLCAYGEALHGEAIRHQVLLAMLIVSGWHIVENDLSLARAYRSGLALGPVPRATRHHALALGVTTLLGALAMATPTGATYALWSVGVATPVQSITVPDLATAVLMYHAVSWLVFFRDRGCTLPPAASRSLRQRLLWLHAAPLALNAVLYAGFDGVYFYVASPVLYLFWSVLHAAQTAAARGLAPARQCRAARVR
jgi:hypothetical protein